MCQLNEIELDEFDALAIPGGFEETNFYEDAFSEEFLNPPIILHPLYQIKSDPKH